MRVPCVHSFRVAHAKSVSAASIRDTDVYIYEFLNFRTSNMYNILLSGDGSEPVSAGNNGRAAWGSRWNAGRMEATRSAHRVADRPMGRYHPIPGLVQVFTGMMIPQRDP